MPFRKYSSLFDDDDIAIMRAVYDAICAELGITASDDDARQRELVATAIIEAAEAGEFDPSGLRARAKAKISGGE